MSKQDELLALIMGSGDVNIINAYNEFISGVNKTMAESIKAITTLQKEKSVMIRKLISISCDKNNSSPVLDFMFAEWICKNYVRVNDVWIHKFANHSDSKNHLTIENLYELWLQVAN